MNVIIFIYRSARAPSYDLFFVRLGWLVLLALAHTFESWDLLACDAAEFHLLLELTSVCKAREEMRLSVAVAVKGSEPLVPLLLWSLRFLEIYNHWELQRGKDSPIDNSVILPSVDGPADIVVGLSLEPGTLVKVKGRPFDVVELKGIFLKDETYTSGLNPKERSKEQMECATSDANEGEGTIGIIC